MNEGVISTHKNVLAYILCISVVDHSDVTVDEIVYLASEFAGDAPEQYEVRLNYYEVHSFFIGLSAFAMHRIISMAS